jgi:hypothetical protein
MDPTMSFLDVLLGEHASDAAESSALAPNDNLLKKQEGCFIFYKTE